VRAVAPAGGDLAPAVGGFACDVDAHADVLATLVVVRGGGQHRVRPAREAGAVGLVESIRGHAGDVGVGADVVDRYQAGPAIERRVFDPLRHHRCAQLLEADDPVVAGAEQDRFYCRQ